MFFMNSKEEKCGTSDLITTGEGRTSGKGERVHTTDEIY